MKKPIIILVVLLAAGLGAYTLWPRSAADGALVLYGNVDIREVQLGFRVSGRFLGTFPAFFKACWESFTENRLVGGAGKPRHRVAAFRGPQHANSVKEFDHVRSQEALQQDDQAHQAPAQGGGHLPLDHEGGQ